MYTNLKHIEHTTVVCTASINHDVCFETGGRKTVKIKVVYSEKSVYICMLVCMCDRWSSQMPRHGRISSVKSNSGPSTIERVFNEAYSHCKASKVTSELELYQTLLW